MPTETPTLPEFLRARIDEERAVALTDKRMRECEALLCVLQDDTLRYGEATQGLSIFARRILGILALPYVDHPDYSPEWRP